MIRVVLADGIAIMDGAEGHQETVIDKGVITIHIVLEDVCAGGLRLPAVKVAEKMFGKDGDATQDIEKSIL